jgi:hypothetical protein
VAAEGQGLAASTVRGGRKSVLVRRFVFIPVREQKNSH